MVGNQKVGLVALLGAEHLGSKANVYNDTEPLGLLYIAGAAQSEGYNVRVFHPYQKANPTEEKITERIIDFQPDVLGVSSMTNTFPRSLELARKVKSALPQTKIVFGGDHVGSNPHEVQSPIDVGVIGEGEDTFREILQGRDLREIDGIAYKKGRELVVSPRRTRRKDRTQLPFAFRDPEILRRSKIGKLMYPAPSEQTGTASLLFQFGCPFSCSYCNSTSLYGLETTSSSSEHVIAEMKELKERFGVNTAFFTDLTFNLNPDKTEELCRRIADEELGINWYAIIRPSTPTNQPMIRDSTVEAMVTGGCSKIGFGIESWQENAMQDYHRPTSLEQDNRLLRKIDSLGAVSKVFLIMGHPDETQEYYEDISRKLKWLAPDEVRISFLTPFPGTELWESLDKSRLLTTDYGDYTTFKPVMGMKHMSQRELVEQRESILRGYYSSGEFNQHIKEKTRAHPRLKKPFEEFISGLK